MTLTKKNIGMMCEVRLLWGPRTFQARILDVHSQFGELLCVLDDDLFPVVAVGRVVRVWHEAR